MSRSSKNKKMKFKTESEYTLALEKAVKKLLNYRTDGAVIEEDEGRIYCIVCISDKPICSGEYGDEYCEEYVKDGMRFTRIAVTHYDDCAWENLRKLVEE